MDRKIPKEILLKEKQKRLIKYSSIAIAVVAVIIIVISLMRDTVSMKNIKLSTADEGTIEVSVSASGKVVPAFEETIIAPIDSRIVHLYK